MTHDNTFVFRAPLGLPPARQPPLLAALHRWRYDLDGPAIADTVTGARLARSALVTGATTVAEGLVARGIERDDVVALALSDGIGWPVLAFGVWLSGAAYAPLDRMWTEQQIARAFAHVRPRFAIAAPELVERVARALPMAELFVALGFGADQRSDDARGLKLRFRQTANRSELHSDLAGQNKQRSS